jgi:hypothetical protein
MKMKQHLILAVLAVTLSACDKYTSLRQVTIYAPDNSRLGDMVDLALFAPFAPGLTFDEANKMLGTPSATETASNLTEYHYYFTNGLRLAVAKETQVSGGMPMIEWWTLYAFPTNRSVGISPERFLRKPAIERIKSERIPYLLVVRDTNDDSSVWCTVEKQGMTEIRWFNAQSREKKE